MRGAPKARDDEFTQERKKAISLHSRAHKKRVICRQTVIVGMRTVELERTSGWVPVLNK
jgi:hypothetical protein